MSEIPAVNVHVASMAEGIGQAPPSRRERIATFYTVVLTSDTPVDQVLRPDPNRIMAWVQAGNNDAVLCRSRSEAQAKANTGDPALARPTGLLLPFGNAAPYPLDTTSEVWAAAASYPTQVTVTVITEGGSQ